MLIAAPAGVSRAHVLPLIRLSRDFDLLSTVSIILNAVPLSGFAAFVHCMLVFSTQLSVAELFQLGDLQSRVRLRRLFKTLGFLNSDSIASIRDALTVLVTLGRAL